MIGTTDSEPFCSRDVEYVGHSTHLLATRNAQKPGAIDNVEPITLPQQIDIVIDWETVRREAHSVMETRFFQDLMTCVVALKRVRAQTDQSLADSPDGQ